MNIFGEPDLLEKLDCFLDFDFDVVEQLDLYWFPLQVVPGFGSLLHLVGCWQPMLKLINFLPFYTSSNGFLGNLTFFEITGYGNKWNALNFYELLIRG